MADMADREALRNAAHQVMDFSDSSVDPGTFNPYEAEFLASATPQAVIDLFNEVRQLRMDLSASKAREWDLRNQYMAARESRSRAVAANQALRPDAKRYRWLRDKSESIHQFYLSTPIWFTGVKFSRENVDKTIDASMGYPDESL